MTAHVQNHEGRIGSGKVSTLIAVLCAMGTDCTEDVLGRHDCRLSCDEADRFVPGACGQFSEGSLLASARASCPFPLGRLARSACWTSPTQGIGS
eukprot:6688134-Prymnesium_polylepis.2